MTLAHPITGEILPDDDAAVLRRAMDDMDQSWRAWRRIRERVAELEDVTLPKPKWQTDKQRRVAACPRCGERVK